MKAMYLTPNKVNSILNGRKLLSFKIEYQEIESFFREKQTDSQLTPINFFIKPYEVGDRFYIKESHNMKKEEAKLFIEFTDFNVVEVDNSKVYNKLITVTYESGFDIAFVMQPVRYRFQYVIKQIII
jgi:hypothetical protein